MEREELIRLAHQAWPEEYRYDEGDQYVTFKFEELERFASLVAAAEREKCAKIIEANAACCAGMQRVVLDSNAAAIRALT